MSAQLERVEDEINGHMSTDGAQLLDDTEAFIRRFCIFPSEHCLTAVTLWAAHAHMVQHFHTTPRLALLSPEPASGKTRVLEVLDLLVPQPMFTLNASPAAVFRTLENEKITLLFDEVDAIWSKRGKDDNHEDLRALLNAGYKRGATIPRCVGSKHEVTRFEVFCAVALAGLGDLPDTIMGRSLIIRMRRRAHGETVDEFRTRKQEPQGHKIRDKLSAWANKVGQDAGLAEPEMPHGIVDRPAEIWEPLLAVADKAGGRWPEIAREACNELCKAAEDRTVSLGVRLLGDLRTIFGGADALYTATILNRLTGESHRPEGADWGELEADAPWSDLRGKPLNVRGLARTLRQYGIRSVKVRERGDTEKSLQGYKRSAMWDAWKRYLPPLVGSAEPEQVEQAAQTAPSLTSGVPDAVPQGPHVPGVPEQTKLGGLSGTGQVIDYKRRVPDVPDVPDLRGGGRDAAAEREELKL